MITSWTVLDGHIKINASTEAKSPKNDVNLPPGGIVLYQLCSHFIGGKHLLHATDKSYHNNSEDTLRHPSPTILIYDHVCHGIFNVVVRLILRLTLMSAPPVDSTKTK